MAVTFKLASRPMRLAMLKHSCRPFSNDTQSKTKAARMARMANSTAPASVGGGSKAKASTSFCAGTIGVVVLAGCVVYNILSNPKGALGSAYYGSAAEDCVNALHRNTIGLFNQTYEPVHDKLLPDWPTAPCYVDTGVPPGSPCPPTLIVDVERTLVKSVHDVKHGWRHVKRPGVDKFLEELSQYYEIVLFTENDIGVMGEILEGIDKEHSCHKLGSNAGEIRDQKVLKRLEYMNRDVRRIIVIDDNPESVQLCMENAIIVPPFTDIHDTNDRTLENLIPFLKAIADPEITDYQAALAYLGTHNAAEVVAEYRSRLVVTSAPVAPTTVAAAAAVTAGEASTAASGKPHSTD